MIIHGMTLTTWPQYMSCVLSHASLLCNGQLMLGLFELAGVYTNQAGEPTMSVPEVEQAAFHGFSTGLSGYESFLSTPLFKRIRTILAMMVVSVVDKDAEEKYPGIYRRVTSVIKGQKFDTIDIIHECMTTAQVAWDVIRQCAFEKSALPLFGDMVKLKKIEVEHVDLTRHVEAALSESPLEINDVVFIQRFKAHFEAVQAYHRKAKDGERQFVFRILDQTTKWAAALQKIAAFKNFRVSPFSFCLEGRTGTGKTGVALPLARDIAKRHDIPHEDCNIATVNCNEKFLSTVHNNSTIIFMDDIANIKPMYNKGTEINTIINVVNNSRTPVEKAHLDEKGQVFFEPAIFVGTTNVIGLNAETISNEPSSILRRFKYYIRVYVKEEFAKRSSLANITTPGDPAGPRALFMLDAQKAAANPNGYYHDFQVVEWVPMTTPDGKDTGKFVPQHEGFLDYGDLVVFMQEAADIHFANQTSFLSACKSRVSEPLCQHRMTNAAMCKECRREAAMELQAGDMVLGPDPKVWEMCRYYDAGYPPLGNHEFHLLVFTLASRRRTVLELSKETHPAAADIVAAHDAVMRAELQIENLVHFGRVGNTSPILREAHVDDYRFSDVSQEPVPSVSSASDTSLHVLVDDEPLEEVNPLDRRKITWGTRTRTFVRGTFARAKAKWMYTWTPVLREPDRLDIILDRAFNIPTSLVDMAVLFPGRVVFALGVIVPAIGASLLSLLLRFVLSFQMTYIGITLAFCLLLYRWITGRLVRLVRQRVVRMSVDNYIAKVKLYAAASFTPCTVAAFVGLTFICATYTLNSLFKGNRTSEEESSSSCSSYEHQGAMHSVVASTQLPGVHDPFVRRNLAPLNFAFGKTVTMNRSQMLAATERMTYVMDVVYTNSIVTTMALAPATNFIIAPAHNFVRPDGTDSVIKYITLRLTTEQRGPVFKVLVKPSTMYRLPGDMMLVMTNAGGSLPNNIDFFTDERPTGKFPVMEVGRSFATCEPYNLRYLAHDTVANSPGAAFQGYKAYAYQRPSETYKGLCGAAILLDSQKPMVLGLHTMGNGRDGLACALTRTSIVKGMEVLRARSVNKSPDVEQRTTKPFVPQSYEERIKMVPLVPKSILRETPDGANMIAIGTIEDYSQVKPKTDLQVNPDSDLVTAHFGVPRSHEPPENYGKRTVEIRHLKDCATNEQIDPDALSLAQEDMLQEYRCLLAHSPELCALMKPLSEEDACSGIPGDVSVQGLNLATACGFPRTGAKRKLFSVVHPDSPRIVMGDDLREEVQKAYDIAAGMERVNFVFKAAQKDEAVSIGKAKVRIFQGAPTAMTYLLRVYFLGVMRMYYASPLFTESSVGINASGPTWDNMFEMLNNYDPDEKLVGDWIGFDKGQCYLEIKAQLSIWVTLAEEFGTYTDEEITVMWVLAEELARHYVVMYGDVYCTEGENASGQALTVFLNNGDNRLRMRAAFYSMAGSRSIEEREMAPFTPMVVRREFSGSYPIDPGYRDAVVPLLPGLNGLFKDYAGLTTYGDDFVMGVRKAIIPYYNQRSLADWFAQYGKGLTNPQKCAFETDYTPNGEVDFLKRGFRHDERVGRYLAPLALKSIFKPFFVVPKKPAFTQEFYYSEIIGAALREFFQYGEDEFVTRSMQLRAFAEAVKATSFMGDLKEFEYQTHLDRYVKLEEMHNDLGMLVPARRGT